MKKVHTPPRESLSGGGGGCQLILDLVGQIPLLALKKKFLVFFLRPINKDYIFVEKLLTTFFILPLIASKFFVKSLSCQKFLPEK